MKNLGFILPFVNGVLNPMSNNKFLNGVYAPVREESIHKCKIEGRIPPETRGFFFQIGPNPVIEPRHGYHWFDGDGMAHVMNIEKEGAFYHNKIVNTRKVMEEKLTDKPLLVGIGNLGRPLGLFRVAYDIIQRIKKGISTLESVANTSMVYHGGSLLALGEAGIPYKMGVDESGLLYTIGPCDFGGAMKTPFNAHPKIDPRSGKMYGVGIPSFHDLANKNVQIYSFDENGELESNFPVPLKKRTLVMHDSAITENFRLILDFPIEVNLGNVGRKIPIHVNQKSSRRVGVLPINAKDGTDMKWVDIPYSFTMFHVVNAWEEDGKIVLLTCDLDVVNFDDITMNESNIHKLVIDIQSWSLDSREKVLDESLDFPVINDNLVGVKNKYAYFKSVSHIKFFQLVKVDIENGLVMGEISVDGRYFGDCRFISSNNPKSEDDGYLMVFTTPEFGETSDYRIYDANSLELVCKITIPVKIPIGFHSLFVPCFK